MDDLQPLRALLREKGFSAPRKSKRGLYLNAYRRLVHTSDPDEVGPYTVHVAIGLRAPREFCLSLYQIDYGRTAHYHYLIDLKTKGFQFEFEDGAAAVDQASKLIEEAVARVQKIFEDHDAWKASPEAKLYEGLNVYERIALTTKLMEHKHG